MSNVNCCVVVTVMYRAAAVASPHAISKREALFFKTAHMASFAGRIPLVYFGKGFALCFEFVLKHYTEHTKPVVVGGLAQLQGSCQVSKIQIFHIYGIVLLGYRSTQRMAEVLPLVGNFLMQKLGFM